MANPMYRQIAEDLRAQIESGALRPGQQIMTEIELRERYSASRNTVRDAIKWLTTLGLVETRPGQGTFVVRKIYPYVTILTADPAKARREQVTRYGEVDKYESAPGELKKREASYSDPQVEIQKASNDVSTMLRIDEGAQVISRHQRRFIDDTPWSLQTSFYPMDFVLRGAVRLLEAGDITTGTVDYLEDTLKIKQVGYRDWIKVRPPDSTEAAYFSLPQDGRVSVFEVFRTAFDQDGKPMRLTVTVFPTDRNQFIVDVGDVPDPAPDERRS